MSRRRLGKRMWLPGEPWPTSALNELPSRRERSALSRALRRGDPIPVAQRGLALRVGREQTRLSWHYPILVIVWALNAVNRDGWDRGTCTSGSSPVGSLCWATWCGSSVGCAPVSGNWRAKHDHGVSAHSHRFGRALVVIAVALPVLVSSDRDRCSWRRAAYRRTYGRVGYRLVLQ